MSRQRQEPTQDDARSLARWENEGGASKREPTQETPKALEIAVPNAQGRPRSPASHRPAREKTR